MQRDGGDSVKLLERPSCQRVSCATTLVFGLVLMLLASACLPLGHVDLTGVPDVNVFRNQLDNEPPYTDTIDYVNVSGWVYEKGTTFEIFVFRTNFKNRPVELSGLESCGSPTKIRRDVEAAHREIPVGSKVGFACLETAGEATTTALRVEVWNGEQRFGPGRYYQVYAVRPDGSSFLVDGSDWDSVG